MTVYICPSDPTNSSNLDDAGESYVPNYGGSLTTNAVTGQLVTTGCSYAANILVFDPNSTADVNASSTAATGVEFQQRNPAVLAKGPGLESPMKDSPSHRKKRREQNWDVFQRRSSPQR